jgi:glycosyltransferase involved in cell wall biosynthesis
MHICFITSEFPKKDFPHGGVGTFVHTIAQKLVQKGVQVSIIGLNYVNQAETENVNTIAVYRLKPSNVKGLAWYYNTKAISKKIAQIHKDTPVDVVETPELGLAFLNKIKSIKYCIRLHGGHHFFAEAENRKINWWKGFQEKRSFKKADAFIAVSNYVKKHTATYLNYNNKPVEVIFYPINNSLFQPQELPVDANNITFAGTVCEKKGIRQLIQAFPKIKEYFPDAILNIYGRDWKFPNGSSYVKILQEEELPRLGTLANDIVFYGAISNAEMSNAYAKAAVCVFPSHMETLGLVAPEAMAMEKTVVFTCLGPGPEVIEDGVSGLLCNPHNPEEIADKIIFVMRNPQIAKQIGEQARKSILQRFEINAIVKENIDFYKSITTADNK